MKKPNLIFDASVIADNYSVAGRGRSGIYFVAYNVLKNLIARKTFNLCLYCNYADNDAFSDFIHQEFGDDIKIYFGNRFGKILKKCEFLDIKLRERKHNILKLLLNIFVRKPLFFIGSFVKLPCFDISLSPMYAFSKHIRAKQKYIILHDAIPLLFPEYYPQMIKNKYWFGNLIQYIKSEQQCRFFTVSENTKKDFIRLLNIDPNKINVMHLAAGDNFYQEKDTKKIKTVCKKYNIPTGKKYVFSLCTLEPRKNLIRAVKTFIEFIKKNKINDMVFVLGGGHWEQFIGKLKSEIKDLGKYEDKIVRIGYVDDEDLSALYSGAEWFVYTSQYEGFGMPPLEAMACGCPVITSNNSSLPEVVGDSGQMIDWDSDEQHIKAYEKYYTDEKYRKSMSEKGLQRAKQFSWTKTVDKIIKQIQG